MSNGNGNGNGAGIGRVEAFAFRVLLPLLLAAVGWQATTSLSHEKQLAAISAAPPTVSREAFDLHIRRLDERLAAMERKQDRQTDALERLVTALDDENGRNRRRTARDEDEGR